MTDVIDQYVHSPRRYQLIDGTGEMNMGVGLLFFAVIMWLSRSDVIGGWQSMVVFFAGLGMIWVVTHFGTRYIRRRLVYPRSGYIKMRKRPWEWALMVLLAGLIGAATTAYIAKPESWVLSPILGAGLLIGLSCLIAALRFRSKKLIVYAAISIVLGILLQFIEPQASPDVDRFWWLLAVHSSFIRYFFIMGIIWLFGGVLALCFYIHKTPERNLEAE